MLNRWGGQPGECDTWLEQAVGKVHPDGSRVAVTPIEAETVTFTGVADNVISRSAGRVRITVCGMWFSVPPLSPGDHTLTIAGLYDGFRPDVEYALTVS